MKILKRIERVIDSIAVLFMGDKFKGSDYTIPELDLSTLPEKLLV